MYKCYRRVHINYNSVGVQLFLALKLFVEMDIPQKSVFNAVIPFIGLELFAVICPPREEVLSTKNLSKARLVKPPLPSPYVMASMKYSIQRFEMSFESEIFTRGGDGEV